MTFYQVKVFLMRPIKSCVSTKNPFLKVSKRFSLVKKKRTRFGDFFSPVENKPRTLHLLGKSFITESNFQPQTQQLF